jgi:hypothetical protein
MKIFGYGVGHFVNDLVAACWFNYLFFFLQRVVKTPAAPSALLAGQIADGIATPIVGYFSDRTKTKYGNKITNNDRSKNSMVCNRSSFGRILLHPNIPNIPK